LFDTWINSEFSNWYRGSIPLGFSHTNNLMEGFNYVLKAKYTDWEKFKLAEFIQLVEQVIIDYSEETIQSPFPSVQRFPKDVWEKAQRMAEDHFLQVDNNFYWLS